MREYRLVAPSDIDGVDPFIIDFGTDAERCERIRNEWLAGTKAFYIETRLTPAWTIVPGSIANHPKCTGEHCKYWSHRYGQARTTS